MREEASSCGGWCTARGAKGVWRWSVWVGREEEGSGGGRGCGGSEAGSLLLKTLSFPLESRVCYAGRHGTPPSDAAIDLGLIFTTVSGCIGSCAAKCETQEGIDRTWRVEGGAVLKVSAACV